MIGGVMAFCWLGAGSALFKAQRRAWDTGCKLAIDGWCMELAPPMMVPK
jgi:hypothetical protein